MATYNQIIYDTLEDLKQYHISDDVDIDYRQIIYKYDKQRAIWLEREFKSGSSIDSQLISSLGCFDLILANPIECCSFNLDCKILRTKEKLPRFLLKLNRSAITQIIIPGNYKENIPLTEYNLIDSNQYLKFKPNKPTAFLFNSYLYLLPNSLSDMMVDKVFIAGVVADTLSLQEYSNCEEGDCFSLDYEYPFHTSKLGIIRDYVMKEFVGGLSLPTKDTSNDGKDNQGQ